ncbi:MAG: M48 family metallopeptidase [Thermodesulfobacteriota bacterium]
MATRPTTMDFFEHQEAARRRTSLLTLYFILAVFFIICGVYAAIVTAWHLTEERTAVVWDPALFGGVALGVVVIVVIGSLYKTMVLSKGGEAVARMLGATPVDPGTKDPEARRLLNVVEEMSIASGIRIPKVYALQAEKGINAFAAGLTPDAAVVAVTRGSMTMLSRDELQGIVAHEFSHILNGDMRINIRLIGIIHGILVIGLIGRAILRGMSSRSSRSDSKKGGGGIPVFVLGLLLTLVGYIGVFFGNLIKAAVSRQREFLADAAAVQFTRNPSGIAGALKKILGLKAGARIGNRHAEEASHLYFANGLGEAFLKLLSTHPPLEERIRRIEPSFRGLAEKDRAAEGAPEMAFAGAGAGFFPPALWETGGHRVHIPPARLAGTVGAPQPDHLAYAEKMISDLPAALAEEVRDPSGAAAVVYALLISPEEKARAEQIRLIETRADPVVFRRTRMLLPTVESVGRGYRLPLADLALSGLKGLTRDQYKGFRENLLGLVEADREISLFEFAVQRMVGRHLDALFGRKIPSRVRYHDFDQVQIECTEMLSVLSWHGTEDPAVAGRAFQKAMEQMKVSRQISILPREKCTVAMLEKALERLSQASPLFKKRLIMASAECIGTDGLVTIAEAEALRAVADSLDCPIPPILPGAFAIPKQDIP